MCLALGERAAGALQANVEIRKCHLPKITYNPGLYTSGSEPDVGGTIRFGRGEPLYEKARFVRRVSFGSKFTADGSSMTLLCNAQNSLAAL
jgi:hypothetical protein